jgi:hypothetical protein
MSGDEARVVFDPELLDGSASELLAAYPMDDLLTVLRSGLLEEQAFGAVRGGSEAHDRLQQTFGRMLTEMQRADVDVQQLATDAMTAAQQAREAEAETLRLARSAISVVLGPLDQLIANTIHISTPGWVD